nr:MAG TPA: hypothetical protein [Caudoviricetes sp.]
MSFKQQVVIIRVLSGLYPDFTRIQILLSIDPIKELRHKF